MASRTIEESRAILERWGNGKRWDLRIGMHGGIPRAEWYLRVFVDGRQTHGVEHQESEALAWHAAADWALQDCPEIAKVTDVVTLNGVNEGPRSPEQVREDASAMRAALASAGLRVQSSEPSCPHTEVYTDREYGTTFCRRCHVELPTPESPKAKYPAFLCSHASAMEQLRRVRGRGGGPFLCFGAGHESVVDFKTFEALVEHCAEHGLDVSEFREPRRFADIVKEDRGCAHTGTCTEATRERARTVWTRGGIDRGATCVRVGNCEGEVLAFPVSDLGGIEAHPEYEPPQSACSECGRPGCEGTHAKNDGPHPDGCVCQACAAKRARAEAAERTLARYPDYALGDLRARKAACEATRQRVQDELKPVQGEIFSLAFAIAWLEEGKPR